MVPDHEIAFDSPRLTPLKQNTFQYKPTQDEILSYAEEVLQLNLMQDNDLIFLAEEALIAPLPQNWQACEYFTGQSNQDEQNGKITEEESFIVYRNKKTKQVTYDHPLDSMYRQKARQLKMMKNTAKYTENITPISEQLIQSSVVMMQKNNSKKGNEESVQNVSSNNFSSNFEESKSKLFNQGNSKTSQLVKNITQESVAYEDQEFENLSMITDHEQEQNRQAYLDQNKGANNNVIDSKKINKLQGKIQTPINKVDLNKLKEKPKIIKPIVIPNQNQLRKKKQKENTKKQLLGKKMRSILEKIVIQQLSVINQDKIRSITQKVNSQIGVKAIQQQMIILRQFQSSSPNPEIKKGIQTLNKKAQQLKQIERQNKVMDEKIHEMMKIIQIERKL